MVIISVSYDMRNTMDKVLGFALDLILPNVYLMLPKPLLSSKKKLIVNYKLFPIYRVGVYNKLNSLTSVRTYLRFLNFSAIYIHKHAHAHIHTHTHTHTHTSHTMNMCRMGIPPISP